MPDKAFLSICRVEGGKTIGRLLFHGKPPFHSTASFGNNTARAFSG